MEGYSLQSLLVIHQANSADFGYYGCAVTNSFGSDELSILLEREGRTGQSTIKVKFSWREG